MYELTDSLDKNWSREIVLSKIKKGENTESIVNNFLIQNKRDINNLIELINIENYHVLDNLISLSECELKLIKKLKEMETYKISNLNKEDLPSSAKNNIKDNLVFFMKTWSNKFVIIALITISLISLTKQAWA